MGWTDWIAPVLSGVGSLYGAYNENQGNSNAFDAMKANEDRRYQDYLNEYNYYRDYVTKDAEARSAAGAAAAAASAKNAAAKSAAEKKAFKAYKKDNKKIQGLWDPYAQTGHRLLPQMEQTYGNALGSMNLLNSYMMSPQFQQLTNSSVPAYQVDIPLPDYLKYGS